jgi:hypothetical protein
VSGFPTPHLANFPTLPRTCLGMCY